MSKKKTHEQFLEELWEKNEHYRSGEFEVVCEYKNASSRIKIQNRYGPLLNIPYELLKGSRPTIRTAINKTEYFINQAREVHGDRYDYSLVDYVKGKEKVKIICPEHGVFEQIASCHLSGRGCLICGNNRASKKRSFSKEIFVNKAVQSHGNKYDYSKSIYKSVDTKVIVNCPLHGDFEVTPWNHTNNKSGCPKCARVRIAEYNKLNNSGWSKSNWVAQANKSKNFDYFKVYVIKCWNKEESFYKVGRTFNKLSHRFCKGLNQRMPYNYEVTQIKEFLKGEDCFDYELLLKNYNKENKYKPNIKFNGSSECFSVEPKLINYEI